MSTRTEYHDLVTKKHARWSRLDHEIVCIGFGSSSIALAIALREVAPQINIIFLERQERSTYLPFNCYAGPYMQHSFLKDLVSQVNPRSSFSYLSYLRSTDQLIKFTNLGSLQPLREQYSSYLLWCAAQIEHQVRYGNEVKAVIPTNVSGHSDSSLVDAWVVEYCDRLTGMKKRVSTKQVICATGLQPHRPTLLSDPTISASISDTSAVPDLLSAWSEGDSKSRHVVVVGDGLEAAEATEVIYSSRFPSLQVTWVKQGHIGDKGGSMNAIKARLHEFAYAEKIREQDKRKRKLEICDNTTIHKTYKDLHGRVHLTCRRSSPTLEDYSVVCDSIVTATGYAATEHRAILQPVKHLLQNSEISLDDDQGIQFKQGLVNDGCGIWLLGALMFPGDVYDNIMANVATKSKTMAHAVVQKHNIRTELWNLQNEMMQGQHDYYQIHKARL